MGNLAQSGNVLEAMQRQLADKLPTGWRIVKSGRAGRQERSDPGVDAILKIRGPSGKTGLLLVQVKTRVEPKDAVMLKSSLGAAPASPVLIAAPFLSARTQARLKAMGLG